MTEEGEQYAHLPFWMQKAVEQGIFDAVTKPATALKISAGDAIGFLGEDIAPMGMAKTSRSTYAHIEVLSADSRMPAFLDNPGKVTAGRKYIRVHPTAKLYTLSGGTFSNTGNPVEKDRHIILPVDKCNPKKSGGKSWYQVGQSYWLSQDDVDLIDQYNLKELGFTALAEETTPDMSASLQHPEMGVRDIVARMIVKHQSEWFGGSSHQKWTAFFQNYDTLRIGFAKKWLDDMEWMSQVEPFSSGQAVWHMHPVMFLDSLIQNFKITKDMLRRVWVDSIRVPDALLNVVADELNTGFERCRINTSNRLNHFIAQVFQEVGPGFNLNENFNYRPNVLVSKFAYYANHASEAEKDGFIPGRQAANAKNIANKAYANRVNNGGYGSGDGWRYRGRGMKQLAFRGNYRSFSIYHERKWGQKVDFEAEPDLLLETVYAVRSELYFWDFNNLPTRADQGGARDVSYSITRIVNQYDNHYDDRFENLKRLLREGVFNEVF